MYVLILRLTVALYSLGTIKLSGEGKISLTLTKNGENPKLFKNNER